MGKETDPDAPVRMDKGTTFVGTAEYVSPEVLLDQESGPASDIWALGCILYKFFVGKTPFNFKTEYLTFEGIIKGKFSCPAVHRCNLFEIDNACRSKGFMQQITCG
jgi:3-phosphoinositide dependent protein kinase-1